MHRRSGRRMASMPLCVNSWKNCSGWQSSPSRSKTILVVTTLRDTFSRKMRGVAVVVEIGTRSQVARDENAEVRRSRTQGNCS